MTAAAAAWSNVALVAVIIAGVALLLTVFDRLRS